MAEYIVSGLALIISFIALRRTSKAKKLEVKHKYLEELYEVRTKANRVRTGTERQIHMIDDIKNICTFISTKFRQLKSKYKSDGVDTPAELLENEEKFSKALESVLENDLELLSSIDNPKDKDFTDIHKLKTLIQLRINEQEANFESVSVLYNELLKIYYSCLYE